MKNKPNIARFKTVGMEALCSLLVFFHHEEFECGNHICDTYIFSLISLGIYSL